MAAFHCICSGHFANLTHLQIALTHLQMCQGAGCAICRCVRFAKRLEHILYHGVSVWGIYVLPKVVPVTGEIEYWPVLTNWVVRGKTVIESWSQRTFGHQLNDEVHGCKVSTSFGSSLAIDSWCEVYWELRHMILDIRQRISPLPYSTSLTWTWVHCSDPIKIVLPRPVSTTRNDKSTHDFTVHD